jgi:hypothetical protein
MTVYKDEYTKEKKDRFMTIRIPSKIDKELRHRAEENTRTLAAQVLHYIKKGMDNEKTN